MALSKTQSKYVEELKTLLKNPNRTSVQSQIDDVMKKLGLDKDPNKALDTTQSYTLAHFAARDNEAVILEYLKTLPGINFEKIDKQNHSPAYHAAHKGNHNAIRSLLKAGADFTDKKIQTQLAKKTTTLEFFNKCEDAIKIENAVKAGFFNVVPATGINGFLSTLHDPKAVDENGLTVAHHIANFAKEDVLKELINKGFDFEAVTANGKTVFDMIQNDTIKANIHEAYQKKLSSDYLDSITDWSKVTVEQLQTLANQGVDFKKGVYAHMALKANNPDVVEYLINQDIDLNKKDADGKTLVQLAAEHQNERILMDLVEHSFQENPVEWKDAAGKDAIDSITDTDLKKNVEKAKRATDMLLGTRDLPPDELEKLLNMGARINAQNKDGKTAISLVVAKNNLESFKFLADHGAKLNWKGKEGNTVVHHAAMAAINGANLDTDFLEVLAQKRVDFNTRNNKGRTSFHMALEKAQTGGIPKENIIRLAETMINAGADFDMKDSSFKPPKETLDFVTDPEAKDEIKAIIENKKTNVTTDELGPTETAEQENTPESENQTGETESTRTAAAPKGKNKSHPGMTKRLSDALVGATDNFFKAVFEGNHKTAEDFAQAFLFNLLAFPLDAGNILLTKVYGENEKDKLDKLIQRMDQLLAQKNAVSPVDDSGEERYETSKKAQNLTMLIQGMNRLDPTAFQLLRTAIGETTPPDITKMTPEQIQERGQKIQQALLGNPDLVKRFQNTLTEVVNTPEGKEVFEKCFEGYNGPVTQEQVMTILNGGRPVPTDTHTHSTPTDTHTPPDLTETTPKIQEAVVKSYQDIMNSDIKDKTLKKLQLDNFLSDLAKEHPEFKTLSKAFTLAQRKTTILNNLAKNPSYLNKSGNLTQDGVSFLKGKKEFDGFSVKEIKETVKMASTLKETLKKGSDEGRAYLDGKFREKASALSS